MKTLNEVIETMERIFGYISDSTKNDALHYLKEFRVVTDICHKHGIASVWGQVLPDVEKTDWDKKLNLDNAFNNDPLTWQELKQMEGKPVWVEDSNDKGEWVLLSGTEDECLYFVYRDCVEYKIYRDEQGIRWQAYRKERG